MRFVLMALVIALSPLPVEGTGAGFRLAAAPLPNGAICLIACSAVVSTPILSQDVLPRELNGLGATRTRQWPSTGVLLTLDSVASCCNRSSIVVAGV
jgi:hypothetical protein